MRTSRALFLDRDGVVNVEQGYVHSPEHFHFQEGIFDLCRAAHILGYLLLVVTNQAGIARGYYTESEFLELTEWMIHKFAEQQIRIARVYYCPYHPLHGIGRYKRDSTDRKPKPGMLLRARAEFNLDLTSSVLIGDQLSDIYAAQAAGVGTKILLRSGAAGTEMQEDHFYISDSLDKIRSRFFPLHMVQVGAQSANRVLADYYRVAASPVRFLSTGQSERPPGYFRMGPDIVCYARLSQGDSGRSPAGDLDDALKHVRVVGQEIQLPFDAGEVVENLRRERYTAHFRQEGRAFNELLRKAYYLIRPLLGPSTRVHLQKIHLRGWHEISFPAWPVDTTVERIHQKLLTLSLRAQGLEKIPFIWFWPNGFSSCAIVTHDVEAPSGMDFCGTLMDLDQSYGIRSSFQVVPENRYTVSRSFLDSITSRGFEVNVHDLKHDGRLYAEQAEFLRRAKRINNYIREYGAQGFRSGVLYRNADWYDAFDFSYDMSLPNVGHLDPQRGGCCTVMPHFIGKIVELPLTCTQDYTLFQILGDYSIDLWKKQIALIRENYGLISLIVHPDYIIEQRAQDTYKALLGHLAQLRADGSIWTALPRDVAYWWRQRSEMELVYEGGRWRVEGPGKERARVAYASLAGDALTYSLAS